MVVRILKNLIKSDSFCLIKCLVLLVVQLHKQTPGGFHCRYHAIHCELLHTFLASSLLRVGWPLSFFLTTAIVTDFLFISSWKSSLMAFISCLFHVVCLSFVPLVLIGFSSLTLVIEVTCSDALLAAHMIAGMCAAALMHDCCFSCSL